MRKIPDHASGTEIIMIQYLELMEMGVWARMVWDFKLMANWAFIFVSYLKKKTKNPKIQSETYLPPIADKNSAKYGTPREGGREKWKNVNL